MTSPVSESEAALASGSGLWMISVVGWGCGGCDFVERYSLIWLFFFF